MRAIGLNEDSGPGFLQVEQYRLDWVFMAKFGKKELALKVLYGSGVAGLIHKLRSRVLDEIIILAYHRVMDIDESRYPFDAELVSCSLQDFEWQMEYVAKCYDPVSFSDYVDFLDRGKPLPGRPLIVSFDDGFDDNFHHAYPILKRLDIPATVFLSTAYIGTRRPFWYDWLVYICKTSKLQAPDLRAALQEAGCRKLAGDNAEAVAHSALVYMKEIPDRERVGLVEAIERRLGMAPAEEGYPECRALDWGQVREMAANGIEFGSHSVSHPILTRLDDEALDAELRGSKRKIEQETGRPCQVVAYPVGVGTAFDARVKEFSRRAGYRIGVSYEQGSNRLRGTDLFAVRRVHVERYVEPAEFVSMLALPGRI